MTLPKLINILTTKKTTPATTIAFAQAMFAIEEETAAHEILTNGIRNDGWRNAKLWGELVASMRTSKDYDRIVALWCEAPEGVHGIVSILKALARAACMSEHHDEGRVFLKRAILRAASIKPKLSKLIIPKARKKDDFATRAKLALHELKDESQKRELDLFLVSGTLLGLVRERGIIGWDKDIDVGVIASPKALKDFESYFHTSKNFSVRKVDLKTDRLRVRHINGVDIDIFPHYKEGEIIWHNGGATRWWNTPFELKTEKFLGTEQFVPANPELYLDENYGDWRTPNQYFDARIDAPNAEVTDPDYLLSLHYFSLLAAIQKKGAVKKRRYIDLIENEDGGEWLDRIR